MSRSNLVYVYQFSGKYGNVEIMEKNEFFRFQLKRNLEMIKNKHGLVYQLLVKFGNVEMMENTQKMDFSYFN